MAQNEIIELVRKYCLSLNTFGIPVAKAYLYGSWARNEANDNSDIDVMVVSPIFDKHNDLLKAKAWRATEKIDLRIEPYTVSLQKFLNDDVSPLLQVVKKEGIEILLG